MSASQGRKSPQGGEGEPGKVRREMPSQDKLDIRSYPMHNTIQTSAADAVVLSPGDLELGRQVGEDTSVQPRVDHLANAKADKVWRHIRDYSLELNTGSPSRWLTESALAQEDPLLEPNDLAQEDWRRSDNSEWYSKKDWYQFPPGSRGYVSQQGPSSVKPNDRLSNLPMAGLVLPPEINAFDFENQISPESMSRQESSSKGAQAPKQSLDSWAPLYRYLGVQTEYDYDDSYDYYQPLEPIMESPLEKEHSEEENEGAAAAPLRK